MNTFLGEKKMDRLSVTVGEQANNSIRYSSKSSDTKVLDLRISNDKFLVGGNQVNDVIVEEAESEDKSEKEDL